MNRGWGIVGLVFGLAAASAGARPSDLEIKFHEVMQRDANCSTLQTMQLASDKPWDPIRSARTDYSIEIKPERAFLSVSFETTRVSRGASVVTAGWRSLDFARGEASRSAALEHQEGPIPCLVNRGNRTRCEQLVDDLATSIASLIQAHRPADFEDEDTALEHKAGLYCTYGQVQGFADFMRYARSKK